MTQHACTHTCTCQRRGLPRSHAPCPGTTPPGSIWVCSRLQVKGTQRASLRDHGEVKGEAVHVLRALAALRGHGDGVRGRARETEVSG